MYTNADTLHNKLDELHALVRDKNPAIFGITEVKPKNNRYQILESELSIQGYYTISINLNNNIGRGIILYVRNDMIVEEIDLQKGNEPFNECLSAELTVNKKEKLLIAIVYRSPNSSETNNQSLLELLQLIANTKYPTKVVAGDFNYRDINWENMTILGSEHRKDKENFIEGVTCSSM